MNTRRTLLLGTIVVAAAVGLGSAFPNLVSGVAYAVDSAHAAASYERLTATQDLATAFEEVAMVIKPSVVNISSVKRIEATQQMRRLSDKTQPLASVHS